MESKTAKLINCSNGDKDKPQAFLDKYDRGVTWVNIDGVINYNRAELAIPTHHPSIHPPIIVIALQEV